MKKNNKDVFRDVVSEYEGRWVERLGQTYFTAKKRNLLFL